MSHIDCGLAEYTQYIDYSFARVPEDFESFKEACKELFEVLDYTTCPLEFEKENDKFIVIIESVAFFFKPNDYMVYINSNRMGNFINEDIIFSIPSNENIERFVQSRVNSLLIDSFLIT